MQVEVKIVGLKPLLQARFTDAAGLGLSETTRKAKVETRKTPRDVAEALTYKNDKGEHWHPGSAIASSTTEAASYHKMKSTRKSMKAVVPGAVQILEEEIALRDPETWKPIKAFEVDSRRIVNQKTRGAQMAHRPRHDKWGMRFTMEIDPEMIDESFVQQLLQEAGKRVGIGCFRPQNRGPYGKFRVTEWKVLPETTEA